MSFREHGIHAFPVASDMDARAFVKVSVGDLGLRFPVAPKAAAAGVHSAASSCFLCEIRLLNFPVQTAPVPLVVSGDPDPNSVAASFYLDEPAVRKLLTLACFGLSSPCLEILVFTGRQGISCGIGAGKQLGSLRIRAGHEWAEGRAVQVHRGWTSIGKRKTEGGYTGSELHLVVKVEPDPRFMFLFEGEPALSPQIIQTQGKSRQPIFSCKFSRDRGFRPGIADNVFKGWAEMSNGDKDKIRKERKAWRVVIHDLSGSAVAAASIATPFVPSPGSNFVSRSNPGAWLILRPEPGGVNSWCPWGRLEAWREPGGNGGLGCRFQLLPEGGGVNGVLDGILISETIISEQKGGEFLIDTGGVRVASPSPVNSRQSSRDFTFNTALLSMSGFVMSCSIQGKGRSNKKIAKPVVQLAMRHVSCVEDAAVFMALAAAVDLSMDACQPFSRKLRKELSQSESSA